MGPRLDGRVALITGTAGGQGRAAALRFTEAGATVVGCDVDVAGGEETVAMVHAAGGAMTATHPVDLAEPEPARQWVEGAAAQYGRIDIVYNNASAARFGAIEDFSVEDWNFTVRNELDLVFYVTRFAWPYLCRQGGVVLNTASIAGHSASRRHPTAAHCATKAAVIAFTRQLAIEGGPKHIRALSLSPGTVLTPGTEALFADQQLRSSFESDIPVGRIALPDDMARVALFLASDDASYMTGTDVVVDGGVTAASV